MKNRIQRMQHKEIMKIPYLKWKYLIALAFYTLYNIKHLINNHLIPGMYHYMINSNVLSSSLNYC